MKHPVTARLRALRRQAFRRQRNRPGTSPGLIEPLASASQDAGAPASARTMLMSYAAEGAVQEQPDAGIDDAARVLAIQAPDGIVWLHLQGTPSAQQLQTLGTAFGLHALALEDVLQLPPAPSGEFVAYDGDPTNYGSKVLAVGTPRGVEIFP